MPSSVPVTLKMRLGWDENSINAPEIARRAQEAGVQLVTVHGRTRSQFYKGRADWQAIAAVQAELSIPLVANGDVETTDDVEAIRQSSGADAVMIGRAAYGRPWHVGELAGNAGVPNGPAEIAALVHEHYDMNLTHYGEHVGLRHSRKHLGWYLERFAPACPGELKARIMTGLEPKAVIRDVETALTAFGDPMDGRAAA